MNAGPAPLSAVGLRGGQLAQKLLESCAISGPLRPDVLVVPLLRMLDITFTTSIALWLPASISAAD